MILHSWLKPTVKLLLIYTFTYDLWWWERTPNRGCALIRGASVEATPNVCLRNMQRQLLMLKEEQTTVHNGKGSKHYKVYKAVCDGSYRRTKRWFMLLEILISITLAIVPSVFSTHIAQISNELAYSLRMWTCWFFWLKIYTKFM